MPNELPWPATVWRSRRTGPNTRDMFRVPTLPILDPTMHDGDFIAAQSLNLEGTCVIITQRPDGTWQELVDARLDRPTCVAFGSSVILR